MPFPPHTFANQSGNVPAQELDDNFNACQPSLGYTPVNKAGDTMTGPLILSGNASQALQAVPLQQAQSGVFAPRGYIDGLTLSTAGSSASFGIAAGLATAVTTNYPMSLGTAYTKTTSAWAVGTGNGSLDTGTIATSTGYHVYLIERTDTGVVDVLTSQAPGTASTVTMTIASPCVVTWTNNGLEVGAPIVFTTTGALPTGLTAGTRYFVSNVLTTNTFRVSATQGGPDINTSGTQSGTHTGTSNPLLPASYTNYRRIGWMRTDGSSQWIAFTQYGDDFLWSQSVNDNTGGISANTLTLFALTVPKGIKVFANFSANIRSGTSGSVSLWVSSPDQGDQTGGDRNTAGPITQGYGATGTPDDNVGYYPHTRTNTTGQIQVKSTSTLSFLGLQTYGWTDPRGKNA